MRLDDPLDNREAQPQAAMRARAWGVDAHEGFEHSRPLLTRDPRPVIADLDDDGGGIGPRVDDDALVRVTHRVAQEILYRSLELALIGA
jgi:hypothetical protein